MMNSSDQRSITAAEVLVSEAEAIAAAARRINPDSIEVVIKLLQNCKSKIVFSGYFPKTYFEPLYKYVVVRV